MIKYTNCNKYVILILCFQLVLVSCETKKRSNYKVVVSYLDNKTKPVKDLRDGRVALDFSGYYLEDSLKINVYDKVFLKTKITTSEKTGKALLVEIDSVKKINQFSIQINKGQIVKINCDQNNQLFTVDYVNDSLKINSVGYFIPGR
jgi:hypothetical protein